MDDHFGFGRLRAPETVIHAIWECPAAQDVWAGSSIMMQKCATNFHDFMQLFEVLLNRLDAAGMEIFVVQAWTVWNQRNSMVHGGQMKHPCWLNKRAADYMEEYRIAQEQLVVSNTISSGHHWQPPPQNIYKLNFDAAVFMEQQCSGVGAIIRNAQGEVMAGMSAKGSYVRDSEEAEALACRQAVVFAMEAGFSELVVEGDNSTVMRAISDVSYCNSLLGYIYDDICVYLNGMRQISISCVKRGGNMAAHSLARYAKNVDDVIYWIEDSPLPAVEALYQDSLHNIE
ncbi:uncharacterized protein LOC142612082 [Castanea sativa]|uniref:uncharacterized protein LOC142612082 n=1 Tax=Castanea sativa TaxID=21020 RepID=UPI003F64D54B